MSCNKVYKDTRLLAVPSRGGERNTKTSSARLERAKLSLARLIADRVFARPLDYPERDC